MDQYTKTLFETLSAPATEKRPPGEIDKDKAHELYNKATQRTLTAPSIELFSFLLDQKIKRGNAPDAFDIQISALQDLAQKHQDIDEHMVSVGGRLTQALPIASDANERVDSYLREKDVVAPSGIELWEQIRGNQARIQSEL